MKLVNIKKGMTRVDVLDIFDAGVVAYMGERRKIDEAAMRKLIATDEEVGASYHRKIERLVQGLIHEGVAPRFFGRSI